MTAALTTLAALFACCAVGLSLRNFLRSEPAPEATSQPAAPQASAMRPRLLSECNPELLRQMPPRTRKRWQIFRCPRRLFVALLLLAGPAWAGDGCLIHESDCPGRWHRMHLGMGHISCWCDPPPETVAPVGAPPPKEAVAVQVTQGLFGCSAVPGGNHGDRAPGPDVGANPPDWAKPSVVTVLRDVPVTAEPPLPWKPAAVALLLLLAGWYAWMRRGGGVLRVRGQEVFRWGVNGGWWVRRVLTHRSDHPTVRVHYQDFDHNTLIGAIWAALGLRFPLVVHRGPYPGRIEFVKWSYGTRSSWRHGTAYLRWFKVMWALLLLLCGGCDKPTATQVTQLPAACWTAPRTAPWGAWTCDSVWSQHWARAYAGCQDAHHAKEESLIADAHEPPRWPWALLGGLLSALVWLPLGARALLRWLGRCAHPVATADLLEGDHAGPVAWCKVCGAVRRVGSEWRRPEIHGRQALRDAWRLSRGAALALLLCSAAHAASTRPDDPPLTPVRCPAGQVLVGGRCVPQKPVRHQGRGWCLLTLDPGRDAGDETDPDAVEVC